MKSNKQPLYTAVGWVAWKLVTRTVKKKISGSSKKSGSSKGKKALGLLAVAGVAGGAAYAAKSGGDSSQS